MQSEINETEDREVTEVCAEVDVQLQESLRTCQDKLEQLNDKYVRTVADLENFKRRIQLERIEWRKAAQAEIFLRIIPIIDDFDRAFGVHEDQGRSPELDAWLKGFSIIRNEMRKLLDQSGVRPIDDVSEFDPELHEALAQVESDKHSSGQIVQVFERGYTFKGTLLRPAKVSVAK